MKFRIQGRMYDMADLEQLTIRDTLLLQGQTAALGREITFGEVVAMAKRMGTLTSEERERDADCMWVFACSIWASKRLGGDDCTLNDVIDLRLSEIDVVADPKDHLDKADPTKPRPASGRGGKRPAAKVAQAAS